MDFFRIFVYGCFGFLLFNLLCTIIRTIKGKEADFLLTISNSLFLLVLSLFCVFEEGIYVDEHNLNGSGGTSLVALLSGVVFLLILGFAAYQKGKRVSEWRP